MPSGQRLSIQQLCELYAFNNSNFKSPQKIVIFDDALTKRTHFKAMQKDFKSTLSSSANYRIIYCSFYLC